MPNWCNNNIEIIGPKAKVDKLIEGAKKGNLLDTMYPMPKELVDPTSPSSATDKPQPKVDGFDNWYDWRISNWATKWDVDVYEGSIQEQEELFGKDDGDKKVTFGFDSAWGPPIGACAEYLDKNNDMSIRLIYNEPGMDFCGVWEDFDDRCYQTSDYNSESKFWTDDPDGKLIDDYMCISEYMANWEAEQKEEANAK